MNTTDMVMDFASIINLIAVLLMMRAIIKDRKVLRGFSVSGTFLTVLASLGFEIGFFLMGNFISFSIGLVNLVFWFMAFVFSFRKLLTESRSKLKT